MIGNFSLSMSLMGITASFTTSWLTSSTFTFVEVTGSMTSGTTLIGSKPMEASESVPDIVCGSSVEELSAGSASSACDGTSVRTSVATDGLASSIVAAVVAPKGGRRGVESVTGAIES
jgi:hypothetical protein